MTYPMPSHLWLSGRVMRWHTHATLAGTGDRLDGHHARVAQIILEKHPSPSVALLRAALTHDAGEYHVGDLPGDMKRDMPDVAERHALVEAVARDTIAGPYPDLADEDATWLCYADRLDAYWWCQFHSPDGTMQEMEWRIAREEINRLAATLGVAP